MKKEVEVKVPAKIIKREATVKKVTRYTCDICGKTVDKSQDNRYGSGMSNCSVCGRDICRTSKGSGGYPYTCWDDHPDDHGDYPSKMCITCIPLWYKLYTPMQERHWKEEEEMEARIKKESLNDSTKR